MEACTNNIIYLTTTRNDLAFGNNNLLQNQDMGTTQGRGSSPTRSSIGNTQGDLLCATNNKQLSNIFVSCVSSLSVLWNKRNIL